VAATPESYTKAAIKHQLNTVREYLATLPGAQRNEWGDVQGLWEWWVQPGFGQAGAADVIGWIRGRFFYIEAKRDGETRLRPAQKRQLWQVTYAADLRAWVTPVTDESTFRLWQEWLREGLPELPLVKWRTAPVRDKPTPRTTENTPQTWGLQGSGRE
jgi:hypothetical protein